VIAVKNLRSARGARVAEAFSACVAAAEFLAICSEAARRGQSINCSASLGGDQKLKCLFFATTYNVAKLRIQSDPLQPL
jgi:hypothetical protein